MTIDLSAPIYERLKIAVTAYNRFTANNDFTAAQQKAQEISSLYRTLADMTHATREINLSRAKAWGMKAKRNECGVMKNVQVSNVMSGDKTAVNPHLRSNSSNCESDSDSTLSQKIHDLLKKTNVRWDDIAGLHQVKELLMETIALAGIQKPKSIKPWKGVLLFGPPGTGKTLLAAAAAGSLNASFYDVKASSILSKYFGDSSKIITELYNSARIHSPSLVFLDEFDALSPSRDGDSSEASRRVLSTLLTELDGLGDKDNDRFLLTLAATNTPWSMDTAVLSRFPRRIYVPLPDAEMCEGIIRIHTKGLDVSGVDLKQISTKCAELFYSGRDVSSFCQHAVQAMIHDSHPQLYKLAERPFDELQTMKLKTRPLIYSDFEDGWRTIKSPMTRGSIERYEQWAAEYGEVQ